MTRRRKPRRFAQLARRRRAARSFLCGPPSRTHRQTRVHTRRAERFGTLPPQHVRRRVARTQPRRRSRAHADAHAETVARA